MSDESPLIAAGEHGRDPTPWPHLTSAQAPLLGRPDVLDAIDRLVADPSTGVRRGRPRRQAAS